MITNFLGIEYSKERVKCALLTTDGKSYEITALETFENDNLVSSLDSLIKWKREKLGDQKINAVVSISESLIFLKELNVPNAKKKALDEAIYWELSSSSPLPPSQAIYEWSEISSSKDELKIVAMAVRSSIIQDLTEKLEIGGIEVVAIEPSSVSLTRVAGENYQKNTMLLIVGDKETDIIILKAGQPVFSTTSDVALKRDKEKWQLSQSVSESIAKSTHELIDFWEEKNQSKIQQVLITGDLVDKYFGLAANINKFAKIPVNIAKQKNITGLKFSELPKAIVNRFYISIGAVIRFGGDVYTGINLIPKEKKQKVEYEREKLLKTRRLGVFNNILGIFLITLIIVATFFITLNISYAAGIKKLNNMIATHPAQELKNEFRSLNSYFAKLLSYSDSQKDKGTNLRKISELTPKEIKITKIEFNNDSTSWVIEGEGSREAILAFQNKLENGSGAEKVTMLYSSLNNDEKNDFEIDMIW